MKQLKLFWTIAALGFLFFSLSSQALYAQDFSSLDSDLQSLEDSINNTIASIERQQKLLTDLSMNLQESENIIKEQEQLLRSLQTQLNEMSETYRRQSALLARYERKSKFWKIFTVVGIPAAAVISGVVVWAVNN